MSRQIDAHTVGNGNYLTGWLGSTSTPYKEDRSFFIYTIPALAPGESIVAAELRLANPAGGYSSADATEILRIAAVTTPTTVLSAGTGGMAAFTDLADGTVLAAPHSVSAASNGTTVVVPLNAAFLTMANSQSGVPFAVGGSLSSLSAVTGAKEYVFGGSNTTDSTTLVITRMANNSPGFTGYAAATPWQTPALIPFRKILARASDADGDTLSVTVAGPASTAGGTAVMQGSGIFYTPAAGFSGADSFPVTIADEHGATVIGAITVNVGPNPSAGGVGANPPTITPLPGGKMGVAFQGIPGRSYTVQRSSGGLGNWVTLATITADTSGKVSFIDENPPPGSAFYRLGLP